MIKRKLVMACLFVLAVQLARVSACWQIRKTSRWPWTSIFLTGTEVSVSGTVEWVREKEKIYGSLSQKKIQGEIRRNHSERIEISGLYQTGSAKKNN